MTTITYNVSSEGATSGNTNTSTLNGAIQAVDTGPVGNYVINVTGPIDLTSQLLAINLPSGSTLTIEGTDGSGTVAQVQTIDGANTYNGFFVYSGNVTIEDLTISDAVAAGGRGGGGSAVGAGGGGAGLGGGLFVAAGGAVTLSNVDFTGDAAKGGAGGSVNNTTVGAGGGGGLEGGIGATGREFQAGGGGGIGLSAMGGAGHGNNGGAGIVPGAGAGGSGAGNNSGSGGPSAGGGGSGASGGGGGAGGTGKGGGFGGGGGGGSVDGNLTEGRGGVGGFGGGGGGGGLGVAGNGGFGGGGGGGLSGGKGGFGAGIGGSGVTVGQGARSDTGGGGGGLGAGGDIFVQQGGSLTIDGGTLSGGSVAGGAGGTGAENGGVGEGLGSGIFLQGSGALTFAPAAGQSETISDVITDQTGTGGTGANAGSWGLVLNGAGTMTLTADDTYSGGTTIDAGTLQLGDDGTTGSIVGGVTTDDGVLAIDRSDIVTWSTSTSGTGAFEQIGTGATILTAAQSYIGGTTIFAGVLELGPDGSLTSGGNVTIDGGTLDLLDHIQTIGDLSGTGGFVALGSGTLTAGTADSTTFAGAIFGSGAFVKAGTGTLTLTGANDYTGDTTISAGTLELGSDGSISGSVLDDATFADDDSGSNTISGAISGSGVFDQLGTGTTILTAADSVGGGTNISAGTLELGSGGSITGNATFADAGDPETLRLDTGSNQLGGDIAGFGVNDDIDLGFLGFSSALSAVWQENGADTGGTLALVDNGSTLASLNLSGQYNSSNFSLTSDGDGGTTIGINPSPPSVMGTSETVAAGTSIPLSTLFSYSEPTAGDTITKFDVYDRSIGTGYFTVNGVAQPAGQLFESIPISQIGEWAFVAGSTGSSATIGFSAYEGDEGQYTTATAIVSVPAAVPPIVTGTNEAVSSGTSIPLSALFSYSEPTAGDPITQFDVYDRAIGTGYFTINGVAQPNTGQVFESIPISQIGEWAFVAGPTGSSATIRFSAYEGDQGQYTTAAATVSVPAVAMSAAPPVVTGTSETVAAGTSIPLSTLFGYSEPTAGDTITKFDVYDRAIGTGYFTINGVAQPNTGQVFESIPISQIGEWAFVAGPSGSSATIGFSAYEGEDGQYTTATATVSAPVPAAPIVAGASQTVAAGTSTPLSTLFSYLEPTAGDTITKFDLYDRTVGTGYFTLNGVAQPNGQLFESIPISQIGEWAFVAGPAGSSATIAFSAYEGEDGQYTTTTATVSVPGSAQSLADSESLAATQTQTSGTDGSLSTNNDGTPSDGWAGAGGADWLSSTLAPYQSAGAMVAGSGSSFLNSPAAVDLQGASDLLAGELPASNQSSSLDPGNASGLAGGGMQQFLQMQNVTAPANTAPAAQLTASTFGAAETMSPLSPNLLQHA